MRDEMRINEVGESDNWERSSMASGFSVSSKAVGAQ